LKRLPVIGTEAFITTITEKYLKNRTLFLEIPEQNALLNKKRFLNLDELLSVVAGFYQIDIEKLKITIHTKCNKPRSVAIYLATTTTGQPLRVIADVFTKVSYSDISQIARKVRFQLKHDNTLHEEINKIKTLLSNYS
jgi:chromosomal replication initiation ATPase DnaA